MSLEKPNGPVEHSRRDVLKLIGRAAPAAALKALKVSPVLPIPVLLSRSESPKDFPEVWGVELSDDDTLANLERIDESFKSKGEFGKEGKIYIHDWVALIQDARELLEGESIQKLMAKTLEPGTVTRLRISARKEMLGHGISGNFRHSSDEKRPSEAVIAEEIPLSEAFYVLDHELVHAVFGQSEATAYGYSLLTQIILSALYPETFLNGRDANTSPILNYLARINRHIEAKQSHNVEKVSNLMGMLECLHEYMQSPESAGLSGMELLAGFREVVIGLAYEDDEKYRKKYAERRRIEGETHRDLIRSDLQNFLREATKPYGVEIPF